MKILLTGALGFTGRHFGRHATQAGHEVVDLKADLTDHGAVAREVRACRPDAVVHLAGISFVGHADPRAFYAVNVLGTTGLLDALTDETDRPCRVLLASSANVYGNCAESPIAETQAPAPVNHYAVSKLAMEYMARTYMDRLDVVIARPFNYTGPGQDVSFIVPKLAAHFASHAPAVSLGNLDVEREFNDVRTVCSTYLDLLADGESGQTYNVCSGRTHSLREIIAHFEKISGHTLRLDVDPQFVRPNEVHRLCGDATKLEKALAKTRGSREDISLESTLRSALEAAFLQ